jgi:5-hydroxyisourate hydrolase-like protein (transthyretin family)
MFTNGADVIVSVFKLIEGKILIKDMNLFLVRLSLYSYQYFLLECIDEYNQRFDIYTQIRQETSKSFSSALTISLLFALVGMLSASYLANGSNSRLPFAFAAEKEFDIDLDIEKDPIKRGDTQDITVTVRNDDTGKRISDADVRLTVYPPDSDSTSATDDTDDDGKAKFKVKIDDDAETGEYDVKIRVSKNGYDTKTINTSFDVIKKHHHDDDDDDDNDGDGTGSAAASAAASTESSSAAAAAASGTSAASAAASLSAAAAAAAAGGSSSSSAASGGSSASAVAVSD